jgi:hypothetical protein
MSGDLEILSALQMRAYFSREAARDTVNAKGIDRAQLIFLDVGVSMTDDVSIVFT